MALKERIFFLLRGLRGLRATPRLFTPRAKHNMPLLFHSTNGQSPAVNLRDALLNGQAPDRGLYLPDKFPRLASEEIAAFPGLPYHEIAFRILSRYTSGVIPDG